MKRQGFTLIEMMTSTALIGVMVLMLVSMTDNTSRTWQRGRAKVEQFREARAAFETVTRRLSRATLNTYWDYQYAVDDPKKERSPIAYVRQSELRFRTGRMEKLIPDTGHFQPTHGVFFQAPLGVVEDEEYQALDRLLNSTGYFLEIGDDREFIPSILKDLVKPRVRSRLMEFNRPAEQLSVFQLEPGKADDTWFATPLKFQDRPVRVVAENILAMVILPRLSRADEDFRAEAGGKLLCPEFDYDSTRTSNYNPPLLPPDPDINPRNQLPPVVFVAMVAIDEISAQRLEDGAGGDPKLKLDFDSLFLDAAKLEDNPETDEPRDGDLAAFEQQLLARKLNYRVFSTSVALRGAKWSRAQTQ